MRRTGIYDGRRTLALCGFALAWLWASAAVAHADVPVLQTAPTISGELQEGKTVTADPGTWSASPTSYAYQWWRCGDPPFGPICAAIDGATGSTRVLSAEDVNLHMLVRVVASNADGDSETASSARTLDTVRAGPPVNRTPPDFSGYLVEGEVLTATTGAWTNSPYAYEYRWYSCDAEGESCPDIPGATWSSYTLRASDVGRYVGIEVVAIGSGGSSQPSASDAYGPISLAPPVNMVYPEVSGTARVGATLTASPGGWTGNPTSFAYQWYSCDDAVEQCVPIANAASSTYAISPADAGQRLGVGVVAGNGGGLSDEAGSYVTDRVLPAAAVAAPAPPPPPAVVALPPRATFSWLATRVRADGSLALTQRVTTPGTFTAVATRGKRTVYARGSAKAKRAGTVTLVVKPTAASKRALRRQRALRVRVKVTFDATGGGDPATKTRTLTVRARTVSRARVRAARR